MFFTQGTHSLRCVAVYMEKLSQCAPWYIYRHLVTIMSVIFEYIHAKREGVLVYDFLSAIWKCKAKERIILNGSKHQLSEY